MTRLDKIRQLQQEASALEPEASMRQAVQQEVQKYAHEFLEAIGTMNAFNEDDAKGAGLNAAPIGETGRSITSLIDLVRKEVDHPALNPASGGHLGYIPGGGLFYAALGDYLADITNRYAGVFFAGPGAVRMENMLLEWMAGLAGYPAGTTGNLTSGGSIANLIAICTARDAMGIISTQIPRAVIYSTAYAHHSLEKAIRIAGLGECQHRYIPTDKAFRMDALALEAQIQQDKTEGLKPFLIIGSAGTTDTGAVDPLERIGEISARYGLWFHADAAYGGFFLLTDEGKEKLRGIASSDSVTMDPHKGLFLPYGSGAVLIKNRIQHLATHQYQANYMQDALTSTDELSPADLSPELTKHFRGLRLWLPLQLCGLAPFRACLQEKLELTRYFYEEIQKLGYETGPEPELSVVIFRRIPKTGDADTVNQKIADAIRADGRVFISTTRINGQFMLRFACLSFRTHLYHVEVLLEQLKMHTHEVVVSIE